MQKIKSWILDMRMLLRSIPSPVVAFFILSVVVMNLLANKTVVNLPWLALDGGFFVSWLTFLTMDMIVRRYGPVAANKINVFAILTNLFASLIFFLIAIIPTEDDYTGFNTIFGGTWFILLSSTIAFLLSGIVNNFLNWGIGQTFKKNPDGRLAFFTRSYVSTFIGQFVDNLVFALLTFMVFAPIFWGPESAWTFLQCLMAAITGAVAELLAEVIFSPIGYHVCKRWERDGVGNDYFAFRESLKNNNSNNNSTPAQTLEA